MEQDGALVLERKQAAYLHMNGETVRCWSVTEVLYTKPEVLCRLAGVTRRFGWCGRWSTRGMRALQLLKEGTIRYSLITGLIQ